MSGYPERGRRIDTEAGSMTPTRCAEDTRSVHPRPMRWATVAALGLLVAIPGGGAIAQTFDEAASAAVDRNCDSGLALGPNLGDICTALGTANALVSGGGAYSQQQRIAEEREKEEILVAAESGRGGSADTIALEGSSGFAAYLSAGAFSLNHDRNSFEDGYNSTIPTVTAGIEYRADGRFLAGLAFDYYHWSGDYDQGGDFDADGYGPSIYVALRPVDDGFVSLWLGYRRQNLSNDRQAAVARDDTGAIVAQGPAPGDIDSDIYLASANAGYDYTFGNFAIGPRVGLDAAAYDVKGWTEVGSTGLQLAVDGYSQNSVQSNVGARASYTHPMSFGVIVSSVSAAWVHEFANEQETISARLIEGAPGISDLQFETEEPARNWAEFGIDVTAVLRGRIRPYANFTVIAGNTNFDSYGGTAGVSVTW